MNVTLGIAIGVIVAFFVAWAYFTAQRLNRLHIKTDAARINLQSALDRRAALVGALLGKHHPALSAAAKKAESLGLEPSGFAARSQAEGELNKLLIQVPTPLPAPIIDAQARVHLAHRFYNESVSDTRSQRTRASVRLFRLGGRASLPTYFEFVAEPLL